MGEMGRNGTPNAMERVGDPEHAKPRTGAATAVIGSPIAIDRDGEPLLPV
jgi:hypothetical protein